MTKTETAPATSHTSPSSAVASGESALKPRWPAQQALHTSGVTAVLRALPERRRNDDKFKLLQDGSLQGTLVYRDGKPLYANRTFASMFGFASVDDLLRLEDIRGLISPDRLIDATAHEAMPGTDVGPVYRYVVSTRKQDGTPISVENFSRIIHWDGARAIQATVIDVTDRMCLEEQLRQAQKMENVGYLAGGLTHEFNNLLQIISGYSLSAMDQAGESPQLRDSLNEIRDATDRCSKLIRKLLSIGRRRGIEMMRNENINNTIASVLKLMQPILGKKCKIEFNPGVTLKSVSADATSIEHVLINLCINSRDAMPNGGRIVVNTTNRVFNKSMCAELPWAQPGEFVEIDVADNGNGIAPEMQAHVFEPYFSTKNDKQGSGLGMYLVRELMQQHNGFTHLESSPGNGTVIKLFLPANA